AVARHAHRRAGPGLCERGPLRRRQHGAEDRGVGQVRQGAAQGARRHHQHREHRARAARRNRHLDPSLTLAHPMANTLLAVNGTLMRGLELNPNMLAAGATFVREDRTDGCYRIWSIGDRHPAMLRTPGAGTRVALEVWSVPLEGLASILQNE